VQWVRCSPTNADSCVVIDKATAWSYKLTADDSGMKMRIALWAYHDGFYPVWKLSTPSATVGPVPTPTPTPTPTKTPTPTPTPTPTKTPTPTPTPTKTPTPTPTPTKTPTPTPTPTRTPTPTPTVTHAPTPTPTPISTSVEQPIVAVVTPTPLPLPSESTAAVVAAAPAPAKSTIPNRVLGATAKPKAQMIRPFPVIRIGGTLTKNGAKISVLTVKAPKGVRITLKCQGRGCPLREVAQATSLWHIPQFERELRAGVKLTITVTKPGFITKVTTITIRKGKSPARSDMCRMPDATKLSRCPK
jgi:hypothetical protein